MFRTRLVAIAAAVGVGLAAPAVAFAQNDRNGYASVNGLEMYYEIHGAGRPLVLLHGALMTIEGFKELLPSLAKTRQVIAVEQQAHGRTADIDRPLRYEQMADDTVALVRQLGIEQADFFGYSMGGGIALQVAIRHPDLVRRLVVAAANYDPDGYYPEVLEGIQNLKPEDFAGSPWLEAYTRVAPNPEDWPALLARIKDLDLWFEGWPSEDIASIAAPALVIVGDADVVRPEHAVEIFRLLGGGVPGDLAGPPRSRLAVLPGTTHVTLVDRADWLTSMVTESSTRPCQRRSERRRAQPRESSRMSLKLYFHPLSSFCQKALIALYENDTPFEPHIVDLADEASRAELTKIWPPGKFPVLRDEAKDRTIPESSIIIEYLAQHYPGRTQLVPADADLARQTRLRDRFFDLYVNVPMQKVVTDRLRPAGRSDPHGVEEARALLRTACGMIDQDMETRTWAMGDAFSMADCAAAPALFYADKVMPFGDTHRNVAAYLDRLMARPSFARAIEEAQPYFALFPK